jgi:hypothetical protein
MFNLRSYMFWSGAAATVGGTLLCLFAVLVARKPAGCIGDHCGRPLRDYSDVAGIGVAGLILIAAACGGLVLFTARSGSMTRLVKAGAITASTGIALLFLAVPAGQLSGELPPIFVLPGVAALAIGGLLLGIGILRTGILPTYAAAALVVGAVAILPANDETWRIVFVIPFGAAWVIAGIALLNAGRLASPGSTGLPHR